jgi:hypothetical protein
VSLKQVFKIRADRVALVLENPKAGPKKICFNSADLSCSEKLKQLHGQFPKKKQGVTYLYLLSLKAENLASLTRLAFRNERQRNSRKMSRDNEQHPNSSSLYVGASGDLYSRFRTHLGRGNGASTWALYLSAWAIQLETNFVVEYYEFTDAVAEDVELIEGVLWDSLCPLFGKKGGR